MKGAIFGFQKRGWCPKWTPASSICRMDPPAISNLLLGLGLRASFVATLETLFAGTQPSKPGQSKTSDTRVGLVKLQCVAKKGRALYHEDLVRTTPYATSAPRPAAGRLGIS